MTVDEVRAILGPPCKTETGLSGNETDDEELKFESDHLYEWYGESFPDPTNPQITFADNKVVVITIFKQSGPLKYEGMNLHNKSKRQDVLEALAKDEDQYFYNEEGYFYPKSGLIVPLQKYAKDLFYIMLSLTSYMMPRLEYEMYEPSTNLD